MSLAVSTGRTVRSRTQHGPGWRPVDLAGLEGTGALGCVFGGEVVRAPWADPAPYEPDVAGSPEASGDNRLDNRLAFGWCRGHLVAVAVHGRFTNGARLRQELAEDGALFQSGSEAEVLLHLVAMSGQRRFVNRIVDALWRVEGSYSLILLTEDHLVAVRDPTGHRPLVLGRAADAHLFASEDGAIRAARGEVRREVHPGEMLIVDPRGLASVQPFPGREVRRCAQEVIALARSDATVAGVAVHSVRWSLGEELGRTYPCPGSDLVCAAPGAETLALGYAFATGVAFAPALAREPGDVRIRVVPSLVQEKMVVLVAASLGTGRDVRGLVDRLMEAGARAVHLRVASPPVLGSCPFGVASPLTEELVAPKGEEGAADVVGAWTVAWLPLDATRRIVGHGRTFRPGGAAPSWDDPQPPGPVHRGASFPAAPPSEAGHPGASALEPHGLCDVCFLPRTSSEPPEEQLVLFHGPTGT